MEITDLKSTIISVDVKPKYFGMERWGWGKTSGMTTVIVEISTDEGIVGLGESWVIHPSAEITKAIIDATKPLLLREDPFDVEKITHKLYYSHGFFSEALAKSFGISFVGVDMAIWDIIGKACGRPLYKVLGGAVQKKVPYKASVPADLDDLEHMTKVAQESVEDGFKTLYIKVGVNPTKELEAIKRVREAVGPDINIRIDANGVWSVGFAIRFIKKVERFDLEWVEQPVPGWDLNGMAFVRKSVDTPIAANESAWSPGETYNVIRREAADIILVDPRNHWGILGCKKVAAMAQMAGIPVSLHCNNELGIAQCAFTHLVASTPNFLYANQTLYYLFEDDVIKGGRLKFKDGCLEVSERLGIGVELDYDKVKKYAEHYRKVGTYGAYAQSGFLSTKQVREYELPTW